MPLDFDMAVTSGKFISVQQEIRRVAAARLAAARHAAAWADLCTLYGVLVSVIEADTPAARALEPYARARLKRALGDVKVSVKVAELLALSPAAAIEAMRPEVAPAPRGAGYVGQQLTITYQGARPV